MNKKLKSRKMNELSQYILKMICKVGHHVEGTLQLERNKGP